MKRKRGQRKGGSYPIWVTRDQAIMVREAMGALADVIEDKHDTRLVMGVISQAKKAKRRLS